MVEAEVNFVSGLDAAGFAFDRCGDLGLGAVVALDGLGFRAELGHRCAERAEVVDHRLVDQDVAVGEKEDAFFRPGFPQAPNDLERGVGFAGAGSHD